MDKDIDLNTSGALPSSSGSRSGATANALGGASMTDMDKGYAAITDAEKPASFWDMPVSPSESHPGFLNRPCGHER